MLDLPLDPGVSPGSFGMVAGQQAGGVFVEAPPDNNYLPTGRIYVIPGQDDTPHRKLTLTRIYLPYTIVAVATATVPTTASVQLVMKRGGGATAYMFAEQVIMRASGQDVSGNSVLLADQFNPVDIDVWDPLTPQFRLNFDQAVNSFAIWIGMQTFVPGGNQVPSPGQGHYLERQAKSNA